MKKRSVTRVHLTDRCPGPPSRWPPVVHVPSGSLAIAALAPPLQSVSSLHWRSPAVLSIAGVWAIVLTLRRSFTNTVNVLPSCLLQAGVVESSTTSPGYCLLRLILWWRTRRAPTTGGSFHTGTSLQCSRPVPRSVVLYVPALLFWRCRPSR